MTGRSKTKEYYTHLRYTGETWQDVRDRLNKKRRKWLTRLLNKVQ